MSQLKCYLYSCLLLQAVMTIAATDPQSLDPSAPVPTEINKASPKVDWPAVGDSVEVHNVVSSEEEVLAIRKQPMLETMLPLQLPWNDAQGIAARHDHACAAPNGRGIANLLKQARSLIHSDKIHKILKKAASDREVQALKQLIKSQEFQMKLIDLKQTRDFNILKAYACEVLHLDVAAYKKFASKLLHLHTHTHTSIEETIASAESMEAHSAENIEIVTRPGIRGLLQDIRDALPRQQLKHLYAHLLATDEELVLAVHNFKAPEFKKLLSNLRNLQDYKDLREMLQRVGLPVVELKKLLDTAMGWEQQQTKASMPDVEDTPTTSDISIAFL